MHHKPKGYLLKLLRTLISGFMLLTPFITFSQTISYYLEADEIHWNSFHVRIMLEQVNQPELIFIMPSWRPGIYMEQDLGKYIQNFEAFGEAAEPLPVFRLNTQTWSVKAGENSIVRVDYDVDHTTPRLLGKSLDASFIYVDGAETFMYLKEKMHLPLIINFSVPNGWKLATALPPAQALFEYTAANYDHLIDCPVYMGKFKEYYFTVKNRLFYVIITGGYRFDMNSFLVMIKNVVSYQIDFFSEIPFDKYFFLFQASPKYNDLKGIAHRNSTYIQIPESLLRQEMKEVVRLIANHFFQIWNGKKIQPTLFRSLDYTSPVRTKNFWFVDGVTDYYADLMMIRAKVWSEQEFLNHQAKVIQECLDNPDQRGFSMERMSLSIWETNYPEARILQTIKGHVLGLMFDLCIREATANKVSLDNLLRFLNVWFAKDNTGYGEDDIRRAINALTYQEFSDFFHRYVSGNLELPFHDILHYAGIVMETKKDTVADLGFFKFVPPRNKIIKLDPSSSLSKAGVKIGDYLYSINNQNPQDYLDVQQIIFSLPVDKEIPLIVGREGDRLNFMVTAMQKEKVKVNLDYLTTANERQLNIRRGWLEGISCR